jgi:hypothetical protein
MLKWKRGLLAICAGLLPLAALPSFAPSLAAPAPIDDGSQPFWIEQIAGGLK